ncbi:hypothetical protein ZIOFF_070530 [Zingiber officinale]|uniref:Nucleotide-diphospho-sugar transferase domain-containing protein n=1 Tax=Zingiber officinale TaxID=94328 RepID=A0A8J5BZY1_ZINOF|nr:hypothetical protein ZIOFF_070530 [Zingiber officinale]
MEVGGTAVRRARPATARQQHTERERHPFGVGFYSDLVRYLASGCKPKEKWRIGTEHEKFGFEVDTLCPMNYEQIADLLNGLAERFDWDKVMEENYIIGLKQEKNDVKLEKVLKEAAMENKTVILTTLNAAWASPGSIIDLFFQSFRTGDGTRRLLDHLVIIALDKKAYIRCISLHTHCFALYIEGMDFSDEKIYMTAGYLSMMWRRIEFLRVILEMGYNFIFSFTNLKYSRVEIDEVRLLLKVGANAFCRLKQMPFDALLAEKTFVEVLKVVAQNWQKWTLAMRLENVAGAR